MMLSRAQALIHYERACVLVLGFTRFDPRFRKEELEGTSAHVYIHTTTNLNSVEWAAPLIPLCGVVITVPSTRTMMLFSPIHIECSRTRWFMDDLKSLGKAVTVLSETFRVAQVSRQPLYNQTANKFRKPRNMTVLKRKESCSWVFSLTIPADSLSCSPARDEKRPARRWLYLTYVCNRGRLRTTKSFWSSAGYRKVLRNFFVSWFLDHTCRNLVHSSSDARLIPWSLCF